MRKFLLPLAALCTACQAPADDFDIELDLEPRAGSASGDDDDDWHPHPINPQLCENPEQEPSAPPLNGECDIEVRIKNTQFVTGQGVSEGKGEISTVFTATTNAPPSVTTTSIPATGSLKYTVGESKYHGQVLATYTVPAGGNLPVQVCADFTEHDNGGINGADDLASGCTVLNLQCDPVNGQPSFTSDIGPLALCGPNQCNGSVAATIKVMRADADMDGVDNDDDFTPEPCDELEKGENGIALLEYFHYDDDEFTTLAQSLGADLSRPYPAYDFKVLLIDSETSNPAGANSKAIREADYVFPPTRAGLLDAMQLLTSEGYRFDGIVHAHGYKNGADDSKFEVLDGGMISGNWLVNNTEPGDIGTARGGVPLMAWWSTTCIAERQIDAWKEIGGLVASGAVDVQFYPNAFHNYVDNWLSMQTYLDAVDNSVTPGVVTASEALIAAQGATAPWWCVAPTVLGLNVCAEDFFNDDVGPNDAAYNIWEVYDHTVSGADNMAISSERDFIGDTNLRFGAALSSWP